MKKSRLISLSIGLALALAMPGLGFAGPVEDALAARNPTLAALRQHDEKAFAAAVAVIADHERAEGLTPGQGKLPETTSPGRDMGSGSGKEFTSDNPDILWLYNSSPEGMSDLISILKSAGQKPKN
ncbi:hypothetical protein [Rhizobium sp. CNPSo 3490]|uniref:hypothetical protein n=1 Tax=Rhizobium sp. CNPSo 3490 TaxID=3021407 RepID=UPI00254FD057|nr:hypothetical protein [Rhizobium sp. CNPSo 3490]MDK4735909.1 hypothetical protein [Rhizobium sp. CNPSo 3490]